MHTNPRLLLWGAEAPGAEGWAAQGSLPAAQGRGGELGRLCCRAGCAAGQARAGTQDRLVAWLQDRLVAQLAVVVGAVPLDVDAAHAVAQLEALVVLAVRGLAPAAARGLQQGVVWDPGCFIQQHIQCLLVNSCLGEFNLQNTERVLLLIHPG